MRIAPWVLTACLLAALPSPTVAGASSKGAPNAPSTEAAKIRAFRLELFERINVERLEQGLDPVVYSCSLECVAAMHSADMSKRAYFEHESPEGENIWERVTKATKLKWGFVAENLAAGYRTPESLVEGWMKSKGHRENLLSRGVSHGGLGIVDGGIPPKVKGYVVTLVLASSDPPLKRQYEGQCPCDDADGGTARG